MLQRDRDGVDRGRHPGHHRGADRPGTHGRAVAPRARLGPAGAVDPARPGPVARRTTRSPTARRSVASRRGTDSSRRSRRSRSRTRPAAAPISTGASGTRTTRRTGWPTPTATDGLSPLARNAIAGVLAHLPGLLGLTTPSVNSFRRLQPHYWSSAYTAWGIENREAAVRVPSRYWDDEAGSTNLELKASDASANPYISLGGVIAAALDGIERGLDPGEPVNEDPGNLTEAERAARGHPALPGDGAARRSTSSSRTTVLMTALGGPLGDGVPQGPARRGGRLRRAGHRLRARAALLQVLSRAGPMPLDLAPDPDRRQPLPLAAAPAAGRRRGVPDPPDRVVLPGDRPGRRPPLAVLPVDDPRAGRPARLRADARRRPRRAVASAGSSGSPARSSSGATSRPGSIDTGYGADTTFSLDELRDLAPCRIEEIIRLEPLIERLILDSTDFDGFLDAYRASISDLRARGIVGLKSVIAYRTGLQLEAVDRATAAVGLRRRSTRPPGATARLRIESKPLLDHLVRHRGRGIRPPGRPDPVPHGPRRPGPRSHEGRSGGAPADLLGPLPGGSDRPPAHRLPVRPVAGLPRRDVPQRLRRHGRGDPVRGRRGDRDHPRAARAGPGQQDPVQHRRLARPGAVLGRRAARPAGPRPGPRRAHRRRARSTSGRRSTGRSGSCGATRSGSTGSDRPRARRPVAPRPSTGATSPDRTAGRAGSRAGRGARRGGR